MVGCDSDLPTVSIVTVTRNLIDDGRTEAIRVALEAAQEQGDAIVEHVIWDGASTDGTVALLKGLIAEIEARPSFVPIRFQSLPGQKPVRRHEPGGRDMFGRLRYLSELG